MLLHVSTVLSPNGAKKDFDLKLAVADNRLVGLWRLATGYRTKYLGATVSLGFAAVARTATFFLLRYLVDDVLVGGGSRSQLALVALGFIVLAVVQGGLTFLSGTLAAQTAEGVARRLRNYLYDHIQRLPFTYHDKTPTGELIQRCTSDVDPVDPTSTISSIQRLRAYSSFAATASDSKAPRSTTPSANGGRKCSGIR